MNSSDLTRVSHCLTVGDGTVEKKSEKKSEEKSEQLITYESYINRGFRQVVPTFEGQRDLYHAIALAALVNCSRDESTERFSTVFSQLFSEKNKLHLPNVLRDLSSYDNCGTRIDPSLEMLIVDFLQPKIQEFVSSHILSQESKTPLHETWKIYGDQEKDSEPTAQVEEKKAGHVEKKKRIQRDIPHDMPSSWLFSAISEILATKIVVFSPGNTICYGCEYTHEIVLIQTEENHYCYLTNKLDRYYITPKYEEKNGLTVTNVKWGSFALNQQYPLDAKKQFNNQIQDRVLTLQVFSFLHYSNLTTTSKVSRQWKLFSEEAKWIFELNRIKKITQVENISISKDDLSCLKKITEKNSQLGRTTWLFLFGCHSEKSTIREIRTELKKTLSEKEKKSTSTHEKKDGEKLEKKETAELALLEKNQYRVIQHIIDQDEKTFSTFCQEHPDFTFNYVSDLFLSPLFLAKLFPNASILKLLLSKGAKLLPESFPLPPEQYFLISLKMARTANKQFSTIFPEIIADTLEALVVKEILTPRVLDSMLIPLKKNKIDDNFPFEKTVENLLPKIAINTPELQKLIKAILSSEECKSPQKGKWLFSLAKHYDLSTSFQIGKYPLFHLALVQQYDKLVQYLIQEEKSDMNVYNTYGDTALLLLCTLQVYKDDSVVYHLGDSWGQRVSPLKERELKLVKQLLEHKDIDVNCCNQYSRETPLYIAASRRDLELCSLLLAHPNMNLRMEDNSLLLHIVTRFKDYLNSSPRYKEIIKNILQRDDVAPLPLCIDLGCVPDQLTTIPLDILRLMLLHPNTRKTTYLLKKENDETVPQIWSRNRTLSPDSYNILFNIWKAQGALHQAETALIKNDFKTTKEKLTEAVKLDSDSLDLYIQQVFMDFPQLYPFDIGQLVYLLQSNVVLATKTISHLMLLTHRHFQFTRDILFVEGLCYRAEKLAKTEEEKKSIQSTLLHQQKIHASIPENKEQKSSQQNLVSTLQSCAGLWSNTFKSQTQIFLNQLSTQAQNPQAKYQWLLEKYLQLTCEVAPQPVLTALRASITELREQLFRQEQKLDLSHNCSY